MEAARRGIDLFEVVERLYRKDPELTKNGCILFPTGANTEDIKQVELVPIIRALPLHLLACLLSGEPNFGPDGSLVAYTRGAVTQAHLTCVNNIQYLRRGLDVLCTLWSLLQRRPKLAEAASQSSHTVDVVKDLVLAVLLFVAGPGGGNGVAAAGEKNRFWQALNVASLVPVTLQLLCCVCGDTIPGYHGKGTVKRTVQSLLNSPKDTYISVLFDSVTTIFRMVWAALVSPQRISADSIRLLADQAGYAMIFLAHLCTEPQMVRHLVDGTGKLAVVRMVVNGLSLLDEPVTLPCLVGFRSASEETVLTLRGGAAVELLAARCLALLAQLSEPARQGDPYFLGAALNCTSCSELMKTCVEAILSTARTLLQRPHMSKVNPWVGETQLTMNLMRMLVVLGDDSMLKEELMEELAEPLAGVLLMEGTDFRGRWCGGEEAQLLFAKDSECDIRIVSLSAETQNMCRKLHQAGQELQICATVTVPSGAEELYQLAKEAALERALLLSQLFCVLEFFNPSFPTNMEGSFAKRLCLMVHSLVGEEDIFKEVMEQVLSNLNSLYQFLSPLGSFPSTAYSLVTQSELTLLENLQHRLKMVSHYMMEHGIGAVEAGNMGRALHRDVSDTVSEGMGQCDVEPLPHLEGSSPTGLQPVAPVSSPPETSELSATVTGPSNVISESLVTATAWPAVLDAPSSQLGFVPESSRAAVIPTAKLTAGRGAAPTVPPITPSVGFKGLDCPQWPSQAMQENDPAWKLREYSVPSKIQKETVGDVSQRTLGVLGSQSQQQLQQNQVEQQDRVWSVDTGPTGNVRHVPVVFGHQDPVYLRTQGTGQGFQGSAVGDGVRVSQRQQSQVLQGLVSKHTCSHPGWLRPSRLPYQASMQQQATMQQQAAMLQQAGLPCPGYVPQQQHLRSTCAAQAVAASTPSRVGPRGPYSASSRFTQMPANTSMNGHLAQHPGCTMYSTPGQSYIGGCREAGLQQVGKHISGGAAVQNCTTQRQDMGWAPCAPGAQAPQGMCPGGRMIPNVQSQSLQQRAGPVAVGVPAGTGPLGQAQTGVSDMRLGSAAPSQFSRGPGAHQLGVDDQLCHRAVPEPRRNPSHMQLVPKRVGEFANQTGVGPPELPAVLQMQPLGLTQPGSLSESQQHMLTNLEGRLTRNDIMEAYIMAKEAACHTAKHVAIQELQRRACARSSIEQMWASAAAEVAACGDRRYVDPNQLSMSIRETQVHWRGQMFPEAVDAGTPQTTQQPPSISEILSGPQAQQLETSIPGPAFVRRSTQPTRMPPQASALPEPVGQVASRTSPRQHTSNPFLESVRMTMESRGRSFTSK